MQMLGLGNAQGYTSATQLTVVDRDKPPALTHFNSSKSLLLLYPKYKCHDCTWYLT